MRLVLLVLLAVVLQATVLARLPLPGAAPDLVLVLVVVLGLLRGPRTAMLAGFAAGLLVDLAGDAELGRAALALVVVGFLAGQLSDDAGSSSPWVAALAGGALAAVAVLLYAAGGVLLSDPRTTLGALWRSLASLVPYSAVLAPVALPVVAALLRRPDRRP